MRINWEKVRTFLADYKAIKDESPEDLRLFWYIVSERLNTIESHALWVSVQNLK